MTSFVLVHGGSHGAWCWAPLFPHLEAPALALDLPGRGSRPADLARVRCDDFAASAAADIARADLRDVIAGEARELAGADSGDASAAGLPEALARHMFCNDMDEEQTRFVLRDQSLQPEVQDAVIAGLEPSRSTPSTPATTS